MLNKTNRALNRKSNIGFAGIKAVIIAFAGFFIFSCSPVKYVPENSYLLNKVELEVDNPKVNKE